MADDEKIIKENPRSRIEAINLKNFEIIQKNPQLFLQIQSRTKLLDQLRNRVKAPIPENNDNIRKGPNLYSNLKPIYNFAEEHSTIIDLFLNSYDKVIDNSVQKANLIGYLNKFRGLAKKSGHPNLGEIVERLINKVPTLGKQELETQIVKINEMVKNIRKPSLYKEFVKVNEAYNKIESRSVINEVSKVVKLENKVGLLKIGKIAGHALGGLTAFFDVKTLVDFGGKFFSKNRGKLKAGEYVDAGIAALSIIGTALGLVALTAAGASLAPVAAAIGTVALTASVAKYLYDNLISDEALKALPQKPNIMKNKSKMSKFGSGFPLFYFNDKLPSEGVLNVVPKIPSLPRNARGTSYFSGGLSLVGEEGPELVNLPRGSQVFSNSRTQSLLNGMGNGGAGITVNYSPQITIQGNADARVMKTASDNSYADFERKFNALMDRRRRLSFAGG